MNKTTILTHIANFAEAIALVARELASTPEQAASPAAPPVEPQEDKPKRGRKPKAEPEPNPALNADVHRTVEPNPALGGEAPQLTQPEGLTRDDLRLLFEPVVKRGDGPKVKEALKKYGVEKLADLEAKDFAAFKADIEVLLA